MRVTDVLRTQHREIDDLFRRIERIDDDAEVAELFDLLAARLVAHEMVEREHFHATCLEVFGEGHALLGDTRMEHGLVLLCLTEVERADDAHFRPALAILREVVAHHARHEEGEIFTRVEASMEADALDALGLRMAWRFEQALTTDLWSAARLEIRQLLTGPFGAHGFGEEASSEPRIEA